MSDYVQVDDPNVNDIIVHAAGEPTDFIKPCVNCGLHTGSYCDGGEYNAAGPAGPGGPADGPPCLAAERIPTEQWRAGQRTPFCTACEAR
jgi:hypothetical protein